MTDFLTFFKNFKTLGLESYKRYYANYKGVVSNNEDPDGMGRLQLFIPQIYGDTAYKYWATPKGLFAGDKIGFYALPNKNDFVWVEFENGDPRFPIWSYGWWTKGNAPEGASPSIKVFQTTSGHRIELDDENNLIRLKQGTKGYIVEINTEGISHVASKISLGSLNSSEEKALLGDTTKAKMEAIIDKIDAILDSLVVLTVGTAFGPSTPPLNIASFQATKAELVVLKQSLEDVLSTKVTLD